MKIIIISILLCFFKVLAHSEFERYVESKKGTLPYPFESLESDLKKSYGQIFGVVQIHSRALNAYDVSVKTPRRMIVPISSNYIEEISPFFITNIYGRDQLEVLSWNKRQRRYDFLIVENYNKGKKPRLLKGPSIRNKCLTCHQNGGPIFSGAPWAETTDHPDSLEKLTKKGPPIDLYKFRAEDFDTAVRTSHEFLEVNRFCKELCKKDDLKCKKSLLFKALLPYNTSEIVKEKEKILFTLLENRRFALPSSVVSDFNPHFGLSTYILNTAINSVDPDTILHPLANLSEELELGPQQQLVRKKGYLENYYADPMYPRPGLRGVSAKNWRYIKQYLRNCYDFSSRFKSINESTLAMIIFETSVLDQQLIANHLNTHNIESLVNSKLAGTKPKLVHYKLKKDIQANNTINSKNLFAKYCVSCHGTDGTKEQSSFSELLRLSSNRYEVISHLKGDKRIMPPKTFKYQPSEKERQKMIEMLKGLLDN